uniref:Uncharacterized protein n=1 Tax=Anopheles quadriannulatus TaxID=34691 RepID=A0A182XA43_ANOQN
MPTIVYLPPSAVAPMSVSSGVHALLSRCKGRGANGYKKSMSNDYDGVMIVTGIVGRADVLACIFFLISLLVYHG